MKLLTSLALVASLASVAAADSYNAEATLEVIPRAEGAPVIQATITDGGQVPLDQIRLSDDRGVTVRATAFRAFKDGPDTVAIAIVVASSEVMMGNETYIAKDAPERYLGYHAGVRDGLVAMDLAKRLPPGSRGTLITYDDHAKVRVPMGPIGMLGAAALGFQRDYSMTIGTDLVGGVRAGLEALSQTRATRKLLIVVGDGGDTNNETAKPALAELKKRAAADRILTSAVIYKGVLSDPTNVILQLVPDAQTVASLEGLASAMKSVVDRLENRYTVTFSGDHFRWDGKPHPLTVHLGGATLEPATLYLGEAEREDTSTPWYRSWWKQLLLGLGIVGSIVVLMKIRAA